MVKIRLRRTGTRNAPCYRIVVADAKSPRDGRFIENLGFYDPCHSTEKINLDRFNYWVSVGAQASRTVQDIARRIKDGTPTSSNKAKIKKQKKEEEKAKEKATVKQTQEKKPENSPKEQVQKEQTATSEEQTEKKS